MKNSYSNSFDIVRHIAALMVLYSHHYALSGMSPPSFLGFGAYGTVGVTIFFVISGFLIAKSCMRSENFMDYMEKRIRRIFPGLIACCAIMVFIVIPLFNAADFLTYITSSSTYVMFINGSFLLSVRPNDIFNDFIYPITLNGSLWTLAYEFLFYLIIGCLIVSVRNYKAPLVLFVLSAFLAIFIKYNPTDFQFYGMRIDRIFKLLMIFAFGSLLAFTEPLWNSKNYKIFLSIVALLIILTQYKRADFFIFGNIALCFLIIAFSISFKDHIIKHRFDISYGIYIYAFPVQQIVINKSGLSFVPSMLVSTIITVGLAILSWIYVEKRFLRRS